MSSSATTLVIIFQLMVLGLFIWFIMPYIRQENWKEKFWNNPHAKALIIAFTVIGLSIFGFKMIFEWLVPPLEILK